MTKTFLLFKFDFLCGNLAGKSAYDLNKSMGLKRLLFAKHLFIPET